MGSPTAALRGEATVGGLDASSLFARAAVPLSADNTTTGGTPTDETQWAQDYANTGQTGSGTSNVDTSNLAATDNTSVHQVVTTTDTTTTQVATTTHATVNTNTDTAITTTPGAPAVVTHQTTPDVHLNSAIVQGDPHWTIDGTTWTETGTPENTYLLASGNGVMVTGLYVMNGYDYCTIGAVQVVIPADDKTGTPEMHIQYNLTDLNNVIVNGQQVSIQNFNHQYDGVSITQESGGPGLVVTTHNADNQVGQYTIDGSWNRGFSVTVNGSFDDAGGIINYLGTVSGGQANVNQDTTTINSYVETNFNLTAGGYTDGIIDKSAWPTGTSVGW